MRKPNIHGTVVTCLLLLTSGAFAQQRSGEFHVQQSWSQEADFKRLYFVRVPDHEPEQRLPVLIFLHGNGGEAERAMTGFLRRHRTIASKYVTVFPNGYARSWNIVSERSKADDTAFIEAIVQTLAKQSNIQSDNFSILGVSNGAALANQLAIESRLPNIRNLITSVSPLNSFQYDGKNFKLRGKGNSYQETVKPLTGRRLMNISGTDDRLVPYEGGLSRAIPAKGGKLGFVSAERSTFVWARHMGYSGEQLTRPTRREGRLEVFSYLDGDVVHYKVSNEGHGATGAISERALLAFLSGRPKRATQGRRPPSEPLRRRLRELVHSDKLTSAEADSLFQAAFPSEKRER